MADPTPPTPPEVPSGALLLAAAISAGGPLVGPYVLMSVLAFLGAMVSLSMRPPTTIMQGIGYLFRSVVIACVLTGLVVVAVAAQFGVPAAELVVPCAFFIGWRHEWALEKLARRFGGPKDDSHA
jgi:hypothetical protein